MGVSMSGDRFAMISGWMENGTINQFIKKHPDVDRLGLVSLQFLLPLVLQKLRVF